MLHRVNAQLLEDPGRRGHQPADVPALRSLRGPVPGRRIPTAGPIFDEMVAITERWLARADRTRPDAPWSTATIRAALLTAMALGIPLLHHQVSRALGTDMFSPEGDRLVALALLDIYSHTVIDDDTARSASTGFGGP